MLMLKIFSLNLEKLVFKKKIQWNFTIKNWLKRLNTNSFLLFSNIIDVNADSKWLYVEDHKCDWLSDECVQWFLSMPEKPPHKCSKSVLVSFGRLRSCLWICALWIDQKRANTQWGKKKNTRAAISTTDYFCCRLMHSSTEKNAPNTATGNGFVVVDAFLNKKHAVKPCWKRHNSHGLIRVRMWWWWQRRSLAQPRRYSVNTNVQSTYSCRLSFPQHHRTH